MSKKFYKYEQAQRYIKDKDLAITSFIQQTLSKTQQIFRYENLPSSIPENELENILQTKGHGIFARHNDKLYVFTGSFSGEVDEYNRPKEYIIVNTALNLSKTFTLNEDSILIRNDYQKLGLLPIIQKYGVLLLDSELSLNTTAILSRLTMLISAPDDKTKASAEVFINKILNGDFSVIAENGFFEGVKIQAPSTFSSNTIKQLVELIQYLKASFLNELGLQANYNMKREKLIVDEVGMNMDALLPFIDNMFQERQQAIKEVNEMFGTDISVDFSSAWKNTHEHAEKELLMVNTNVVGEPIEEHQEPNNEPINEPSDEPSDEPNNEPDNEQEETEEPTEEPQETEETEEVEDEESKRNNNT